MTEPRDYESLDRDPQLAANVAHLRSVLGLPPARPRPVRSRPEDDEAFLAYVTNRAEHTVRLRAKRTRRHRGGLLAAAAAVIVAVMVAAGLQQQAPAYAATPAALPITTTPETRPVTLAQMAQVAQYSIEPLTVGPVEHLVTDRWDLNSRIDDRVVASAVIAYRRELWRHDDVARIDITYRPPQFPTDADRQAWHDAGSPRGGYERHDYDKDDPYPTDLPGRPPPDPGELAAWLSHQRPGSTAVLRGVTDLLNDRVLTAAQQAAVLRILDTETPLAFAGTTTDRAGRPGAAFTMTISDDNGQNTYVVVIDTRTGRFLAIEKILLSGGAALKVRLPAVISYRTYLSADRVAAIP